MIFAFAILSSMVKKHTRRIVSYGERKQLFVKFFDLKSFLLMIFMIGLGISLRNFHLVSEKFIAIFYTGLGVALFMAGLKFLYNFLNLDKVKQHF